LINYFTLGTRGFLAAGAFATAGFSALGALGFATLGALGALAGLASATGVATTASIPIGIGAI